VPEPPKRPPLAEAMRYAQVGTMLIAPMIVLGAIGHMLDRHFATAPWLLLAGLLLGMATGFVNFFRLVLAPPGGEKDDRGGEGR
jgi:F0F1-type ATP synthase assembly protein I